MSNLQNSYLSEKQIVIFADEKVKLSELIKKNNLSDKKQAK